MKKPVANGEMSKDSVKNSSKRERKEWIGQQLRRVYRETLVEPIPDDLLELLKQVESKTRN